MGQAKPSIDARGRGVWEGGFIQWGRYYIRKQLQGKRHTIAVGDSYEAAMRELRAFRAGPEAYLAKHEAQAEPGEGDGALLLSDDLIAAWAQNMTRPGPKRPQGASRLWIASQRGCLVWWQQELGKRQDLRKLTAERVDGLRGNLSDDAWRHKVRALRSLWRYLVKKLHVKGLGNPLQDVEVPTPRPAQDTKAKENSAEDFHTIRTWLDLHPKRGKPRGNRQGLASSPWTRLATLLVLEVQRGTGWHAKETMRLGFGGVITPGPYPGIADARHGTLYTPKAKHGRPLAAPVTGRVYVAAQRLQAQCQAMGVDLDSPAMDRCYDRLFKDVEQAKAATGVQEFQAGWARHTKAKHDKEQGLSDEDIARQLGNSAEMVREVYASRAMTALPEKPLL